MENADAIRQRNQLVVPAMPGKRRAIMV